MIFTELKFPGVFMVDIEQRTDNRGFFARSFCTEEFRSHGLLPSFKQCNISFNHKKGTLRGLHFKMPPAAETKVIRCTAGAIYYAIVDARPESSTYLEHLHVELSAESRSAIYVPPMFAIGYQTLVDNTEVYYLMGEIYTPGSENGFRWNDPQLGISWPLEITEISEKDLQWPMLATSKPAALK